MNNREHTNLPLLDEFVFILWIVWGWIVYPKHVSFLNPGDGETLQFTHMQTLKQDTTSVSASEIKQIKLRNENHFSQEFPEQTWTIF